MRPVESSDSSSIAAWRALSRPAIRKQAADALAHLRHIASLVDPEDEIVQFAKRVLQLEEISAASWARSAWFGRAASFVFGRQILDRRAADVFTLVEPVDWKPLDEARASGRGVIVLGAHLGPRLVLQCVMFQRVRQMLSLVANPEWKELMGAAVVNLSSDLERRGSLVAGLAHLRAGGVMFAAGEGRKGADELTCQYLNAPVSMADGLPVLAHAASAPTVPAAALWQGDRIRIEFGEMIPPPPTRSDDALRAWAQPFLTWVERIVRERPDNVRLRGGLFKNGTKAEA